MWPNLNMELSLIMMFTKELHDSHLDYQRKMKSLQYNMFASRQESNLFCLTQYFAVIIKPSLMWLCRIWKRPSPIIWRGNYLSECIKADQLLITRRTEVRGAKTLFQLPFSLLTFLFLFSPPVLTSSPYSLFFPIMWGQIHSDWAWTLVSQWDIIEGNERGFIIITTKKKISMCIIVLWGKLKDHLLAIKVFIMMNASVGCVACMRGRKKEKWGVKWCVVQQREHHMGSHQQKRLSLCIWARLPSTLTTLVSFPTQAN